MAAPSDESVGNLRNKSDENEDMDDTDNEYDKGSLTEETAVAVGGVDGRVMESDVGSREAEAAAAKAIRLGRKGDPRMHKALEARLQNPEISHVDALIAGGFEIRPDCTNDDAIIDGVTLSQRKNQLSRRLRNARKQQRLGVNSNRIAASTAKSSSFGSTNNKKRKQSSSSTHSANNSISSSSTTNDTATLQRVIKPADDRVGLLVGGGGGIPAAAGTNVNRPQQLSVFPTPNPIISQLNNHPSSLVSIIAAQRAALESFQFRAAAAAAAEKQSRRRSSLDTTSTATTETTMNRGNIINNNHNHNVAFTLANNTTNSAVTNLLQQHQQHQQLPDVSCADATTSSLAASLLAQQQLEYHRQQLAQLLASTSTSVAANGYHFPYDPTMTNYFGIPAPFGTTTNSLPFGGPPTTSFHPPSCDPTSSNTNTTTSSSNSAAATYPNSLTAAANMNTAVNSQSLAALALANNPMLYRGIPFPLTTNLAGTTANMNATADSTTCVYHNFIGPQQQQQQPQLAEQLENFNLKHAIDTSIAELLKKPKNAAATTTAINEPTTATTTTNTNSGGSVLDKSNHSDISNINSNCSKKPEAEESLSSNINNNTNNDNNTNDQEGSEWPRMKRRESSKEALNLFASIGTARKNRSSSTVDRKFSVTRIQPAADLMSVLLSDFDDDTSQDNNANAYTRRSGGPGIRQQKQDKSYTNQGEGAESPGKVSFSITSTTAAATNDDSIQTKQKSSFTPARSATLEVNLRNAFREFNTDSLHGRTVAPGDLDKVELAMLHYKSLNKMALRESMLNAGFEQHQASDSSPIFVEIAFLSLEAEVLRLLDLKRRVKDDKKLGESTVPKLPQETCDL